MTEYDLTTVAGAPAPHSCTSDLAKLREHNGGCWECLVCHAPVFMEEVVEMLRLRAVAYDAIKRVGTFQHLDRDGLPRSCVTQDESEATYHARVGDTRPVHAGLVTLTAEQAREAGLV